MRDAGFNVTPEKMLRITPLIRERIKLLRDVLTAADFFFVDQLPPYDPAELIPQKGDAAMALKVLKRAQEVLANAEFKHDPLDQALRAAAQELGVKAGQMFQPIRVAVCGRKNAPPLFETLEVLGTGNDADANRTGDSEDRVEGNPRFFLIFVIHTGPGESITFWGVLVLLFAGISSSRSC